MRRWLATVSVQLKAKSYPHEHQVRVTATSLHTAAHRALLDTERALRRSIARRQIHSVRIDLMNFGPVKTTGVPRRARAISQSAVESFELQEGC